jgi:CheY-like chemotaxis protein
VTAASSADEALAVLKRERPHVLLADLEMPGEDGCALLRQVRALPPGQGGLTPAVAVTARVSPQEALMAGFQVHVPKPFEPAELGKVVARLAGRLRAPLD